MASKTFSHLARRLQYAFLHRGEIHKNTILSRPRPSKSRNIETVKFALKVQPATFYEMPKSDGPRRHTLSSWQHSAAQRAWPYQPSFIDFVPLPRPKIRP